MSRLRHGLVASLLSLSLGSLIGCNEVPVSPPSVKTESSSVEAPTPGSSTAGKPADVQLESASTVEAATDDVAAKSVVLTSNEQPKSDKKKSVVPDKPLFDGWGKPALALVLSGEQHGYFEPCGCAENQSGGVSRRHDLIKQMQAKGWPLTGLDLGGTVNRNRPQTKLKFQTFLAAMKDMRYSVLNLGPEELKLGAADLLAYHAPDPKDPSSLGFVSANVTLFGSPDLGTPVRFKVLTLGKHKVGVASVLGASFRNEIAPPGANVDISIDDPVAALPPVLKEMQAQQPDLLVLLSHGTLAEGKVLATKFPGFAVVLTSGGAEDPEFDNPQKVGQSLVVQVGHKGKYTGVVGFFPEDPQNRVRFELIKLTQDRFQDSDRMIEHMKFYQELLMTSKLAETEPPIKTSNGAKFVGSKTCGECHTKAFAVWQKTGHAHAYESLITGRPEKAGKWVSRIHDPECLACHATGWHPQDVLRYVSGFESKQKTPLLLDNGCENCHGPGSKHIELLNDGNNAEARKEVRITLADSKKTQCYTCHDGDNSPKFKADTYWEKIKHAGLD
jgi:hypothetical protein